MAARRWIVAVLSCLVITGLLAAFKYVQISRAIAFGQSFPEPSEVVESVVVSRGPWLRHTSTLGEVVAVQSIELRNEVAGIISTVGFGSGDAVKAGQILIQLDVSEEKAQLKAARAQATLAQLARARYQKLMTQNASSKDQYDQAQAQYEVALAQAEALEAEIAKKTVTAPFDAHAGLHQLEVGQYLASNSLITRLVGLSDDVWVDFNLPQFQARLPIGNSVVARASGLLKAPVSGQVIARSPSINPASRNIEFRAVLPGAAPLLPAGSLIDLDITLDQQGDEVIIPVTAVRYDSAGTYVYEITEQADEQGERKLRARRTRVTLGDERDQRVLVTEGLKGGERIAVNGSFKLREGLWVKLYKAGDAQ